MQFSISSEYVTGLKLSGNYAEELWMLLNSTVQMEMSLLLFILVLLRLKEKYLSLKLIVRKFLIIT